MYLHTNIGFGCTVYLGEVQIKQMSCGEVEPTTGLVYISLDFEDGTKLCFRVPKRHAEVYFHFKPIGDME